MSTDGEANAPEIGSDDWWQNRQRQRAEEKAQKSQTLKAACPALASLGILHIVWSYNGEGDSGEIHDVTITGNGTAPKTLNKLKATLTTAFDPDTCAKLDWDKLEDAVWQLIPDGFENNDGGYGEVDLDTANSSIQVRHSQRVIDVEYEEENF